METALAERDADSIYSVTELANLLGITPRAIRFYESKGLMSPRRAGTIRVYNYYDHGHLKITLRGKRLGFSLSEIGDIIQMYDSTPGVSGQLTYFIDRIQQRRHALQQQHDDIEVTLRELNQIEKQCRQQLQRLD